MSYVIQVLDQAGGVIRPPDSPNSPVGSYVKSFDPDAHDGRGDAVFTKDPEEALHFEGWGEAMELWKKQSKVRPLRHDGKPNRPLTAFTVTILTLEDARKGKGGPP